MGLIGVWAPLAARVPRLANFFTQTPGLSNLAKFLGGIAQERHMPPFATETFKEWFRRRGPRNEGRPQVILFPDTFKNYFQPDIGKATVEVLEAAGYQVLVAKADLGCGRPLYDFGMLDLAGAWLRQIMGTLRPWVEAGIPIVGMEPSCLAVFRDELGGLFPNDHDAKRLALRSYILSEFLNKHAGAFRWPKLHRKAMVQAHCHHKSVMGIGDEEAGLKKMGIDFSVPWPGCCGMAGSFGLEAAHYDVSQKIGEQALLPAVRQADQETLVIADGFSCYQQIVQGAGRTPLPLAEVIRMALRGEGLGAPEEAPSAPADGQARRALVGTAAAIGTGLALAGLAAWALNSRVRA